MIAPDAANRIRHRAGGWLILSGDASLYLRAGIVISSPLVTGSYERLYPAYEPVGER